MILMKAVTYELQRASKNSLDWKDFTKGPFDSENSSGFQHNQYGKKPAGLWFKRKEKGGVSFIKHEAFGRDNRDPTKRYPLLCKKKCNSYCYQSLLFQHMLMH